MIKKISSKCINNNSNITYVLRYHDNGVDCQLGIFDKVFNTESIETENTIKLWIHDIILRETGMDCNI